MSKKRTVEPTTLIQLHRNSLGRRRISLCGLAKENKKLILHEAVIVGALKVSGDITNTAINENVFGFNCQTRWRWKKLYVFSNNNIWIIECTSVRCSFPNDPTNPSASLLTSTKPSQVKSLLGKENNFAVKNSYAADLLDSRHKVIKVRFCFYCLWRDCETRKTVQDLMLWKLFFKGEQGLDTRGLPRMQLPRSGKELA